MVKNSNGFNRTLLPSPPLSRNGTYVKISTTMKPDITPRELMWFTIAYIILYSLFFIGVFILSPIPHQDNPQNIEENVLK